MTARPRLSVSRVSVTIDDTEILRHCSFDVEAGSLCAVLGENGSGKTTLLKTVAGFLPHSGTINLEHDDPRPVRFAFAGDGSGFHENRTVRRHIALLIHTGLVLHTDVWRMVDRLDLGGLLDKIPARLSLGQRQSVALLGPLAARADTLLLDEPFVGLDAARWDAVASTIEDLLGDGTTVLATSHDLDWIEDRMTQTVLLDNGEIAYAGTPSRRTAGERRCVEITTPQPDTLVDVLVGHGYTARVDGSRSRAVVLVETDRVDPVVALADAAAITYARVALVQPGQPRARSADLDDRHDLFIFAPDCTPGSSHECTR